MSILSFIAKAFNYTVFIFFTFSSLIFVLNTNFVFDKINLQAQQAEICPVGSFFGEDRCISNEPCPGNQFRNFDNTCTCPSGQDFVSGNCVSKCKSGEVLNSSNNCISPTCNNGASNYPTCTMQETITPPQINNIVKPIQSNIEKTMVENPEVNIYKSESPIIQNNLDKNHPSEKENFGTKTVQPKVLATNLISNNQPTITEPSTQDSKTDVTKNKRGSYTTSIILFTLSILAGSIGYFRYQYWKKQGR
jgi:hypothetical protein